MKTWHVFLITGMLFLIGLFYQGLYGDPRALPGVLIGTQAPVITSAELETGEIFSTEQFKGKVIFLNFWASWCLECRQEHSNLLALNQRFGSYPDFIMLGINYQDRKEDALEYLRVNGNSFKHLQDQKGNISIDYGVYGVPETFIIDQQGVIRFKYVGPITGPMLTQVAEQILQPLLDGQTSPPA